MNLGRYDVLSEIGRGGGGVVYRARSPEGRELAIKVLKRSDSGEALARFDRERRVLAELGESQGFVELLDAGQGPGGPFLVMPFVGGGTLRDRLRRGPLEIDRTIALGLSLARTIGRAHERGIVHRDLKPENVLFHADGRPLVADMGLAKHFDNPSAGRSVSLSQEGQLRGTIGYIAPEQMNEAKSAGAPADVFSLGAILYECLAGRAAFEGESLLEVFGRVERGLVEPIDRARPGTPSWLAAIVRRCLAADPGQRFADGLALARALAEGSRPRRGRSLVALGALALLLVAAAGVSLVLATPSSGKEARRLAEEAWELVLAHDSAGAVAACDRALELDPRLARARSARALARVRRDVPRALADAEEAVSLDPEDARSWLARGAARRPDDIERALADLGRAVKLDPELALAWRELAEAQAQKGDLPGALVSASRTVELAPRAGFALCVRGFVHLKKGELDRARADLDRAIELDRKNDESWGNRGFLRHLKGDLDGAIEDQTRAIEIFPEGVDHWLNRGIAREARGDHRGALADLTHAIEAAPRTANLWLARGFAHRMRRELDEGLADDTRALELDPRAIGGYYERALLRCLKGDLEGATADATRAIDLDPRCTKALILRGELRGAQGADAGSLADPARAVETAPADPGALHARAASRFARGDEEGAKADLRRTVELDPRRGPAWHDLAKVLIAHDDLDGAIA
ncbi:protein kinase, partial [bacterium]|nr:protein kinase [bacterium]